MFSALLQVITLDIFEIPFLQVLRNEFSDFETRPNALVTSYQLKGVFKLVLSSLGESRLVFMC